MTTETPLQAYARAIHRLSLAVEWHERARRQRDDAAVAAAWAELEAAMAACEAARRAALHV